MRKYALFLHLKVVELAVHLDDRHLVVVVRVRAVRKLNAREGARQLAPARHPLDRRPFVEQERWVEVLHAFLLDHARAEDLALRVIWDEVRGENLDHDVRLTPLGRDVGVEVGLASLFRSVVGGVFRGRSWGGRGEVVWYRPKRSSRRQMSGKRKEKTTTLRMRKITVLNRGHSTNM